MAFKKGHKKIGGRTAGTQNVATAMKAAKIAEFESSLEKHGIDPVAELAKLMPSLEANERATVMVALLPYRYPKLKAIEIKQDNPFDGMSKDELLKFAKDLVRFIETGERG